MNRTIHKHTTENSLFFCLSFHLIMQKDNFFRFLNVSCVCESKRFTFHSVTYAIATQMNISPAMWHAVACHFIFGFQLPVQRIANRKRQNKTHLPTYNIFHHFVSRTFLFGLTAFVYFVYNLFTSYSLIYLIFHHGTQIQNKIRLNHCHSPTFSFLSFILLFSGAFFRSFGNCFGCEHH